ncbi:hypothetical protein [Nocardia sp. NPDC052316]|uniref:hypothetical protein n=1 Tax=Nocardia sp. NPDC052316 TaxID=3364329 RepID=UPI0037C95139
MPRSLALQTETELGGALSVLTLQRRDHQRLDLLLDRSRDRLDQLSRRAPAPLAAGCRGASRTLATVAGAVEHMPPLRRGEHPSTRT